MARRFHNPTNLMQLENILNQAKQNNYTLYYSDTQGAVYVIDQIDVHQNILKVYIGTDPTTSSKISWTNFLKDFIYIWDN